MIRLIGELAGWRGLLVGRWFFPQNTEVSGPLEGI